MHILEIKAKDIKIGMFIEKPIYDNNKLLIIPADTKIRTSYQIRKILTSDVETITINVDKSQIDANQAKLKIDKKEVNKQKSSFRTRELVLERKRLLPVYEKAINTTINMLQDVNIGREFEFTEIEKIVDTFNVSLERNETALVSLTKLHKASDYIFNHSVNVSIICMSIGLNLGLTFEEKRILGLGGLLHDIGKLQVPSKILNKPGKYTNSEIEEMKKHPEYGYRFLEQLGIFDKRILQIVLEHHERWDGNGYPFGLKGEDISFFGRIAAIADVYDALTSQKQYRDSYLLHNAMITIFQKRGIEFDSEIVNSFAKENGIYPIGSLVLLSNKTIGVVCSVNHDHLLQPSMKIITDEQGRRLRNAYEIDLLKNESDQKYKIIKILNPEKYNINVDKFLNQ